MYDFNPLLHHLLASVLCNSKFCQGEFFQTDQTVFSICSRHSANDLLEENTNELLRRENSLAGDAGGTGAAEFDGAKTGAHSRPKGRKGMEGMLVRQDKRFVTMMQDFYVACLKVLFLFFCQLQSHI